MNANLPANETAGVVYKFPLSPGETCMHVKIERWLSAVVDPKGSVVVYGIHVPGISEEKPHTFVVVPTGLMFDVRSDDRFLGTVVIDGWMMWHVFVRGGGA